MDAYTSLIKNWLSIGKKENEIVSLLKNGGMDSLKALELVIKTTTPVIKQLSFGSMTLDEVSKVYVELENKWAKSKLNAEQILRKLSKYELFCFIAIKTFDFTGFWEHSRTNAVLKTESAGSIEESVMEFSRGAGDILVTSGIG